MLPDLTISIISADNLDLLLPCLRSIFEQTHQITLEVYVVDNASTDNTAAAVQVEFPQVQLIKNETRLGFSTNNNIVLERGQGRYLMLLNDDTLILDGALDTLVNFANGHPDAAVMGSWLLNPDLSYQQAYAKFPHPLIEPILSSSYWAALKADKKAQNSFEVDIVSGAALLVRKEILDVVGKLDPSFDPIYSEEFDWCYRIKKAGYKIYIVPESQIIHYGSQTMNRTVLRKFNLMYKHKALFFEKHHGKLAAHNFRMLLALISVTKACFYQVISVIEGVSAKERAALHWHIARQSLLTK